MMKAARMVDKQVAIISPTSMLEKYSTNFHLVLTQRYMVDTKYRKFHLRRHEAGDFIILDNGAAELKQAMDDYYLEEVWSDLKPNMVVAPDVIYDRVETLTRTMNFLTQWSAALHGMGIQIMAVPQGIPNEAWLNCFETFNNDSRIDWLGISMFYHPKFAGRLGALTLIKDIGVKKPCHLLGVWDDPYAVRQEGKFDFVKSIDTAKPIEFGFEGLTLARWKEHRHIDDDKYFRFNLNRRRNRTEIERLIARNVKRFISVFTRGV